MQACKWLDLCIHAHTKHIWEVPKHEETVIWNKIQPYAIQIRSIVPVIHFLKFYVGEWSIFIMLKYYAMGS